MEKSITRRLLSDRTFQKIHDKWCAENDRILREDKDKWNFGIIVRNHATDAFDLMIERAIVLNAKPKDTLFPEAEMKLRKILNN